MKDLGQVFSGSTGKSRVAQLGLLVVTRKLPFTLVIHRMCVHNQSATSRSKGIYGRDIGQSIMKKKKTFRKQVESVVRADSKTKIQEIK